MARQHILGVIFDVDGTLIDSNDAHARAWVDTFAELGLVVPLARVRPLIGMGGDKLIPDLVGFSAESRPGRWAAERRAEIYRERYLPGVMPIAGARELVQRLAADGLALAVASSAKAEELVPMLDKVGVRGLFGSRTSADDAERSKPDPDIVVAALRRLGLPAGSVVMIGDTPYDVDAARAAGVRCIAVECGGWAAADLAGAAEIYRGPAELLVHYDESIVSRGRAASAAASAGV